MGNKNSHIHFTLETAFIEKLKQEARLEYISLSELCRKKMKVDLRKVELQKMIQELREMLKINPPL